MNKIIVWHAPCHDGVTALWAAKQSRAWQDAEAISKAMVSAFEACGWKVVRSSSPGEETEEEQGS